jgi:hypothetical protein
LSLLRAALTVATVATLVALGTAGGAAAFTCPLTPLQDRIDQAQAVFVGRSTGYRPVPGKGIRQRIYTFTIDQEVKGDLPRTVAVRIPVLPANGGQRVPPDVAAGILMSRVGGGWYTTRCGITDPGAVLAEVDKPQGNAVRLLIGILILGAVLWYSIRRVRRKQAGTAGSLAP